MTHEIGHMFGVKHCVYYNCAMNGSNHLQESDRRTEHLCPVCLRKLQVLTDYVYQICLARPNLSANKPISDIIILSFLISFETISEGYHCTRM